MFTCARICVEVDLEKKSLPKVVLLSLYNQKYLQKIDQEQLSFKCNTCHGYGNFTKNCKLNQNVASVASKNEKKVKKIVSWEARCSCWILFCTFDILQNSPNHFSASLLISMHIYSNIPFCNSSRLIPTQSLYNLANPQQI